MNLEQMSAFIIEEKDNGYLLDVWKPMLSVWSINLKTNDNTYLLESFLSKMMEFQRACLEEGDQLKEVWINKDFKECHIHLIKHTGAFWKYTLAPSGFKGQWEIFDVIRAKEKK